MLAAVSLLVLMFRVSVLQPCCGKSPKMAGYTIAIVLDPVFISQAPVIVEPQLREHFRIAHSTPEYDSLLSAAPGEFVGGAGRLAAVVELLSSAVAAAFKDQQLPLPPWRRTKSVLSKWGLGPAAAGKCSRSRAMQCFPYVIYHIPLPLVPPAS